MTQANLCQLLMLAAVAACVAADILPAYRPMGPRGPHPNQKLIKRPFRPPPPRQAHPHYRPQPVHLGRQPASSVRPYKFPPSPPPRKYAPAKHFSPSPPAQPSHYIPPVVALGGNEGAIHTIPAPNLGPNSGRVAPPAALHTTVANPVLPPNSFDAGYPGYKVHEDPAKNSFGLPYYAPDPDPSRPAPHVPITRDPNSHPSNNHQQHAQQFDPYVQQFSAASAPQPAKVAPPKTHPVFTGDPNSRFLQAFQDQYQKFENKQQQPLVSATEQDKHKNDIDYDSGAEVRYSFAPAPASHEQDESHQFDDEEDTDEILEDSGANFGDKLKPNRSKKN